MAKEQTTVEAVEEKIEGFAEDLGKMLHSARSKAEGWMGERQQIRKYLTEIRDTASNLLTQLGHSAAAAVTPARRRRGPGRPKGSKTQVVINKIRDAVTPTPKKKRTMSAAARAAISAAQKARWAKVKATAKKK
jgi:ElaB/YqjD/DUF883 family membrane-anchored ribosome-binding protein